ncbi:DNA ligase 1-like [Mercenaria mercenaria]|uniref:DNA ligase 1-like n=1 Tax=Mercenaria mercenaria TaxID=6596 RepID=UPI00234F6276|nr:DNA ligase 1-like [Mercenaria mercenaria]
MCIETKRKCQNRESQRKESEDRKKKKKKKEKMRRDKEKKTNDKTRKEHEILDEGNSNPENTGNPYPIFCETSTDNVDIIDEETNTGRQKGKRNDYNKSEENKNKKRKRETCEKTEDADEETHSETGLRPEEIDLDDTLNQYQEPDKEIFNDADVFDDRTESHRGKNLEDEKKKKEKMIRDKEKKRKIK